MILAIIVTLWFSQGFWYFEGRLFCNIDQQNVTIFFKNQEWTTSCQKYLGRFILLEMSIRGEKVRIISIDKL